MIGATNETGCVKGFAPSPEPTVSSTAMKAAAPRLRPQKITWSAHGQMRGRSAVVMRIAPNRTFVITPMKYE